jgi:hypothetical protein
MPGGTSGEGKTPTSQQAQADKQRRNGGRPKSSSSDSEFLAALIAQAAASSAQQVNQSITAQAAENKFDPAAFLAAKQNLDEAYSKPWDQPADTDLNNMTRDELNDYVVGKQFEQAGITLPARAEDLNSDAIMSAQKGYDEQLRTRRADALNVDMSRTEPMSNKEVNQQVKKISWAKYNNMTPLQRAAVDYNTMLMQAAKRDNRNRGEDLDTESEQYQTYANAYEDMFGGSADAAKHSPETVALLRQIGYKSDGATELDDFLNLDAAVTAKDMRRLDNAQDLGLRRGGAGSLYSNPVMEDRMDFLGGLVNQTENAQSAALDKGNKILSQFSKQAFNMARADMVEQMGGTPATAVPNPTNEALSSNFNNYYNLLVDADLESKGVTLDTVFGSIQDHLNEDERKQFVKYVQERLINSEADGTDITDSPDVARMRTPEEIAKLLNLRGFSQGGVSNGR